MHVIEGAVVCERNLHAVLIPDLVGSGGVVQVFAAGGGVEREDAHYGVDLVGIEGCGIVVRCYRTRHAGRRVALGVCHQACFEAFGDEPEILVQFQLGRDGGGCGFAVSREGVRERVDVLDAFVGSGGDVAEERVVHMGKHARRVYRREFHRIGVQKASENIRSRSHRRAVEFVELSRHAHRSHSGFGEVQVDVGTDLDARILDVGVEVVR